MAITLNDFRTLSNGEYNAGQIDFTTNGNGQVTGLKKVNHHVTFKSLNGVEIDAKRAVAVDALSNTFADSTARLLVDVKSISMNELGLGLFSGQQATIDAIKKDARDMPGENSYQVDIGV